MHIVLLEPLPCHPVSQPSNMVELPFDQCARPARNPASRLRLGPAATKVLSLDRGPLAVPFIPWDDAPNPATGSCLLQKLAEDPLATCEGRPGRRAQHGQLPCYPVCSRNVALGTPCVRNGDLHEVYGRCFGAALLDSTSRGCCLTGRGFCYGVLVGLMFHVPPLGLQRRAECMPA